MGLPRIALLLGCVLTSLATAEAQTKPTTRAVVLREAATPNARPIPAKRLTGDVCPPFFLRDEDGHVIDPVKGVNADKPYSPKQTCGGCHDYEKITKGYHFQQGADEKPPDFLDQRCQWVSTPGNFGGSWCSPAPLYSYLSPKENSHERTIDMTPFVFVTRGCGKCHPGGGPLEHDRDGRRYDRWMADPNSGFKPGDKNKLDGDYFQARWSETGVMEADCLLCHMPEYNFSERNKQVASLNFRWAPTAAAGFAKVSGAVAKSEPVRVAYDKSLFDSQGRISPHIVVEPRNETCLTCHAKPGWKKRGANFRSRTDVHLAAGLRCVDCHPAGSHADDSRINEREVHQFAKGDDPGGQVRNDLDNTVRDCTDCHDTGEFGAPVATHPGLPPLHLQRIACQTCHVPFRFVKAAQVQAGDVFNPGAKIPTKGKYLWTFYGPFMEYWNHYGDLVMMGYDDKPTDIYRPTLARYKGKIYPVNRVHSAWPGIEIEGKPGLMQPKMSDLYKMWVAHRKDSSKYPELAKITDDNGDGVIEVNRPEEIDALIRSVDAHLKATDYPMESKRIVWVSNDRVYRSGTDYRVIEKQSWEASPYGNVHKYTHDVLPARSALGSKGCIECHSLDSAVFFSQVVSRPFDEQATPVTFAQHELLGLHKAVVSIGAVRETYLKPLLYLLWGLLIVLGIGWSVSRFAAPSESAFSGRNMAWVVVGLLAMAALPILVQSDLRSYALPTRVWLDGHHFLIAAATIVVGLIGAVSIFARRQHSQRDTGGRSTRRAWPLIAAMGLAAITGVLMELRVAELSGITRLAYTLFDVSLVCILIFCGIEMVFRINEGCATAQKTTVPG